MTLLKKFGPQIRLCLFMFRPITLKQLNSSTSSDMFSLLGGRVVTFQTVVREFPGSIPGSGKAFNSVLYYVLLLYFTFLSKTHYVHEILHFILQC